MSGSGEACADERESFGPCSERTGEQEPEKMKTPNPTCPGDEELVGTSVVMETASSGSVSELFLNSSSEQRDPYASLLSSNSSSSSNPFSSSIPLCSDDDCSPPAPRGSDSGIGLTPGDHCDVHTQKSELYNYIDMSYNLCDLGNHSNTGTQKQPVRSLVDREDDEDDNDRAMDFKARVKKDAFDFRSYLEKNPENLAVRGHLGKTFPYVEDQSDEKLLENKPCPDCPVKITVTMDPCILPMGQVRFGVSERESVLSLGKEGVPTVTLSEPEDDSAASSVNHSPNHSPTGRESPSDILFQPVGMKCVNNSSFYRVNKGPTSPSSRFGMQDSSESGDSELEPDSPRHEKQLRAKNRSDKSKGAAVEMNRVSQGRSDNLFEVSMNASGKFAEHGNPSLYSLLREEREAELDSDLLIESASEESPKREQVVKCTLSPSCPLSSPPPVSITVPPAPKKEQHEEKKEKTNTAKEETDIEPQHKEDKMLTGDKLQESLGQRLLEDGGNAEEKNNAKEVERLFFLHSFNKKKVVELLHWQDTKQTSVVFSSMLLLLFSLTQFSVVSVAAYLALAALATTISFRVYKSVLQAVQKTDDGHPFRAYLEKEITLSPEQIRTYVAKVQLYVNFTLKELRRLFLVQDLVDSLKFAVLMWLLTYVGALFNGLTLLIQAVVGVFTVPLVYEKYKKQIDQYLAIVQMQVNSVMMTLREKVPGAKSKNE